MDKKDFSVREYLANRADLVGAIRLPNNAFQRNANTSVVADILFLQKRDRAAVERAEWVDLGTTPEGYSINQYFAQHPEMVLGEITTESTQYGKQETTVKPIEGADLAQQLKAAVENIHAEITEPEITDDELDQNAEPLPADPNVKNFSYTNVDGQVYYRENSYMNKVDLPAVTAERVLGMIALRETTQKLLDCQLHDGTDAEVELLQGKLKDQYKRFTAQYGLINSTANKRAFRQDSSYCLLASLEILDEDKNLKRLADIFTKRTIRKPEPVTSVDTPSEALALSIGEKAKVDVPFIAELCGKTEQEVTEELAGVIFHNPVTQTWVTADEYLSGNVREKLVTAETFAANHPEYQVNVEYLKRVQPKDLNASEIEVRLGANWIKAEYITDFMEQVFKTPSYYIGSSIKATYSEISGAWNISGKSLDRSNPRVTNTYGTMRVNGYRLLEDALNLRDTKIYDTVYEDGKERRVLNKKETMLAQQAQEAIRDAFKQWIFKDTIELGSDPAGNIQRILNALASIEKTLPQVERRLETLQQQLAEAKEEVQRPFPQEAELNEKSARLAELNALLDMDEKGDDAALGMDEEVPDSELPAPKREIERSADSVKRPSIKSIGFSLEDGSIYSGMFDLMVGGEVQAEVVNHIQHYRESPLVQKAISDMKTLLEKRQASKELEERPNTRQSVREALKNRKKAQEQQSNQEQAKPKKAKKKGEMER